MISIIPAHTEFAVPRPPHVTIRPRFATGDFSMFENVGNPTTINPTKELIDKINSNDRVKDKIKIIVERKDVIYELPSNVKTIDISF